MDRRLANGQCWQPGVVNCWMSPLAVTMMQGYWLLSKLDKASLNIRACFTPSPVHYIIKGDRTELEICWSHWWVLLRGILIGRWQKKRRAQNEVATDRSSLLPRDHPSFQPHLSFLNQQSLLLRSLFFYVRWFFCWAWSWSLHAMVFCLAFACVSRTRVGLFTQLDWP